MEFTSRSPPTDRFTNLGDAALILPTRNLSLHQFPAPINVLFVSPWFPNRVHPQDGNFVQRFAELAAQRHLVTVLHVSADPALAGTKTELVATDEPWGKLLVVYYAGGGARVQRLFNRSRAWGKVIAAFSGIPDLIHAHVLIDGGIVAGRLARRFEVPLVVSCHSSRFLEGETWRDRPLDYWLARRAAARAQALLPVSHALRRGLERAGMRANYRVLGNVIDGTIFQPPAETPAHDGFRLFHLSDFSRQKRLDVLLAAFELAFSQIPDLHLTIAGNGDPALVEQLLSRFPASSAAVTLQGRLTRTEVVATMGEHDLFVLSSEVETQGIVLTEALLCGLPVLATDSGGPADLGLTAADGRLVAVNDARAMAETMVAMAQAGPSSIAERRSRHLRYAPKGSLESTATALEEIYNGAMADHQKQR